MRTGTFAWTLITSGCTAAALHPEIPLDPKDRAVVIVVERGSEPQYFASDLSRPEALPSLEASEDAPLAVTVFSYESTLDDLGFAVSSGHLSRSDAPPTSRPLGPWARAHSRHIGLDDDSGWITLDGATADVLAPIRVATAPACRSYTTEPYTLTATHAPFLFAFTDDDTHAYAVQGSTWSRFDRDTVVEVPSPIPDLAPSAAATAPDGTVFVAGMRAGRHEVWTRKTERFELLPGTDPMRSGDRAEKIFWMSAPTSTVVWTLAAGGRIATFDGRWLDRGVASGVEVPRLFGGIAASSAQSAVVIHPFHYSQSTRSITKFSKGRRETIELNGLEPLPYSVGYVPGLEESFFGGSDGRLYRIAGNRLETVNNGQATGRTIFALTPVRSGVHHGVAALGLSAVAFEHYAGGEVCSMSAVDMDAGEIALIGSDLLVLGQQFPTVAQQASGERTPKAALIVRGPPP